MAKITVIPNEVWADKRLTLKQMRVLGALFSFRGKNTDTVRPSRAKIAERSGMSVCHVSTATTELERLGWLRKDGKGGHSKSTRYTITVPELRDIETVSNSGTVPKGGTVPESGTGGVPESGTRLRVPESGTGKEQTIEQTSVGRARPIAGKAVTADTGKKSSASKGSRLPADWQLPKAWGEWALQEAPTWAPEQVRKVAERFRDYWIAKPGREGFKADWLATWRNWVRREAERTSAAPARSQPVGAPDPFRGAL